MTLHYLDQPERGGGSGSKLFFKPQIHSMKFSKAKSILRSMIKCLLGILWGPLWGSQVVKILKTLHHSYTVTFKEIVTPFVLLWRYMPSLQVLRCFWQHLPELLDCSILVEECQWWNEIYASLSNRPDKQFKYYSNLDVLTSTKMKIKYYIGLRWVFPRQRLP